MSENIDPRVEGYALLHIAPEEEDDTFIVGIFFSREDAQGFLDAAMKCHHKWSVVHAFNARAVPVVDEGLQNDDFLN